MKHQGPDNPAGNKLRTPVVTFETNHCDNQESHDVNIIDRQQDQHNITTKLLRIFKSKKWKNKRKNTENVSDKPLAFPKVKLRKPENHFHSVEESNQNSNQHQPTQKTNLKISKSLPVRKPVIVWEEIQEFQNLIPETPKNRIIDIDQDKITVSTQTDISYGVEQRPKLRRLTVTRPQLGVRNDKQKVSLNLTKSSDDDDECNLEVFKALCNSGSASQMTGSPRDADGIASTISEMISPTMMMETEVDTDTDTDTVEDCEDNNNIYEEVLNQDSFRLRNNHSKLSSTSSIYRASWWGGWPSETNNLSLQTFHAPLTAENSVQKPRLCRTAKSIHGPHRVAINTGPADISNQQRGVTKTLSEKFSYLGIKQYSVFRNGK